MKILSLDTSFSFLNFSIIEDGKVKLLKYLDSNKKTLELLPEIFKIEEINPSEFSAFAVSKGMGYLTSLRIGITFMKTWAYMYKKPIITYENLELLAKYSDTSLPKVPYLKVSSYIFYRVCNKEGCSEIRIFKGEKIEGTGITLSLWEDRICEKNKIFPFFPFSAYGGLYAYKILKEGGEGEDPFRIEPIYLK